MKKTITKLVLRRETLKLLRDGELARAVGGQVPTACPQTLVTKLFSGCPPEQGADLFLAPPEGAG